ncbi:flagellar biosynthesis chaperone [Pseudovibrio sp. W64]|uniref:flagellar export protein FliJ n=1 Tax=unclassified Pseudovibrio TaxID=2627060 RepID=UPI00070FAFBA|nr:MULTISPECIES: flagellar export protein FliJ [unclassified Pseudovibrio]KZK76747.1 flagellar biosynthesis chaperone [Pseudovibrio sp. Ad46]KZK77336.1 flagellar biosynthesis chaperone [Pseudovibrio sp. W64]KZK85854.1 flagellar biosynthesis chaperone [Pseudovibrio sp. Ad13]KZK99582.1 flagellar biosynthesis chaperone [Pseudovibrio sp. Ad5]KZL03981.1 flagellar biosynthesis chaperone [Pseudovibrio sp. W74]
MKNREGLLKLKKFNVDEKRRQVTQIETMLSDFDRMAEDLENQIVQEQKRVGIDDISHFAYPTFARAAAQRRDNLKHSTEELKSQLEKAQDELTDAVSELKKIELMDERDQMRQRAAMDAIEQDGMDDIAGRMARR